MKGERAYLRRFSVLLLIALAGCATKSPSLLDAKGPAERTASSIWWPMVWVATAVTVFVVVMGAYGVVRGRRIREEDIRRDVPWGDRFILIAGLGVSGAILIGFFVFSLARAATLARAQPGLEITVIGHDWWWEIRYPNGAVTANEIHIPAGQRVNISLTSVDVIHSLWVPQLGPKIDLIPGRTTHAWLKADQPGEYRGQCAEYCGLQHANMNFVVIAEAPAAFERWAVQHRNPPAGPQSELEARGEAAFVRSSCAGCHTIRGTDAHGILGPDLSDFAGRSSIGAKTVPNDRGHLEGWIADPQSIKPGVLMPPSSLEPDELTAIVAYLESLK